MKLAEILNISPLDAEAEKLNLTKKQIDDASEVGSAGSNPIFKVEAEGLVIFFHKLPDGSIGTFASLQYITLSKSFSGYLIRRSFVPKDRRKKGELTELLAFAYKLLKQPLISDDKQTPSAKVFWKSLEKHFKNRVKVLKTSTSEIIPRDQVSDSELYTDTEDQAADFLLILESYIPTAIEESLPPQSYKVIAPYRIFKDGDE